MDFVASIRHDGESFYETGRNAEPSLGVPSCPGWTIADLVWHLGEVHWFWASDIEQRGSDPAQVEADKPGRPDAYPDLLAWSRSQLDRLVGILEATPDDVAVWTWALKESDRTVAFVRRHQVQETAVHRWDMQNAATSGQPDPIDPEVASDSIDEFLFISLPWGVNAKNPLRGSVHLHCTDVLGEWFIGPDGTVERAHAKGAVALRGKASDLLLVLYDRLDFDVLDVIGDESLARELIEHVDTA